MIGCSYEAKITGSDEKHVLFVRGANLVDCNAKAVALLKSRFARRGRPAPADKDIWLGSVTIHDKRAT